MTTKKRLVSNFFSLSSIQVASYLLPLITIPYLVRVLGVEKFGLIAFSQVVIQYFVIFTDYGFGLSATKEIAENKDNKVYVSTVFSTVISIKMAFLFLSFLVLNIFIFMFEFFAKEWLLFYLSFGVVVGQAIFPVWYFQGVEKMHIIALFNILSRIVFTSLIFLLVSSSDDYLYVPLISSLGFIVSGIIPLWLSFKRFDIIFTLPTINQIKHQLTEGWHVFVGIISSNFSTLNVSFILGIMSTPLEIGYYAAVEKIIRPLASLSRPVINSIFPYLSSTAKTDPDKAYIFSKKITFIVSFLMFIIGINLFVFSEQIVNIVFGKAFQPSIEILIIMAFIPMMQSISAIYNIPNMILNDFKKPYARILTFTLIASVVLSPLFISLFGGKGAAIATVIIELIPLISMNFYLLFFLNSYNADRKKQG